MAAKNAAVNMGLVNHNVGKSGQKRRPLLVMGQNGQIEHFGICDQCDWRIAPDFAAHVITGVAIVQGGCRARFLWPACAKGVEGLQLVLGQGFEGKEIKRPGFRVQQMPFQDGQVVDQAFAAGRRRGGHNGMAGPNVVCGQGLVRIKADVPLRKQFADCARPGAAVFGKKRCRFRQDMVMADLRAKFWTGQQFINVLANGGKLSHSFPPARRIA